MNNKNKRKLFVLVIGFICILLIVFYSDNRQQRWFNYVRSGYLLMQEEKYEEAVSYFDMYLEEEKGSRLYWEVIKFANGIEYTREGVQNARNKCIEYMNKGQPD